MGGGLGQTGVIETMSSTPYLEGECKRNVSQSGTILQSLGHKTQGII